VLKKLQDQRWIFGPWDEAILSDPILSDLRSGPDRLPVAADAEARLPLRNGKAEN
jgi:hypothetical protein